MSAPTCRSFVVRGLVPALLIVLTFGCTGADLPMSQPEEPSPRWAEQQLHQMTMDEKIAQLFMIRLDGYFQNANNPNYRETVELVETFGAGGMMFGPGTPMTQVTMANELQQKADRPLLISQDTEWGVGMRIDEATTFPPAMAIGASRNAAHAYRIGYATAQEARALGVHQIYAPVADVNNNPENPIINIRSFGEQPSLVGNMAAAFTRGAQEGDAIATVKHFPGHGDTDIDSHMDLPVLRFSRSRLDTLELVPFRQTLDAGVKSVMTGHLALPALEPDSTVPASLSPAITQNLLREQLGFNGLVVTDALIMESVTRNFGVGETAVRVLEAGADLLLMSTDPRTAHEAIREAVERGRLSESQINDSVRRLLILKEELGLHEQRTVPLDTTRQEVSTRSNKVLAETVARESLTLLSNKNDLLPLTPPERYKTLVVTLSDSEVPGTSRPFLRALRGHPAIDSLGTRRLDPRSDSADVAEHLEAASDYDVVLVPSFLRVRSWSGTIGMDERHQDFLEDLGEKDPPVVLAAFGNPYAPSGIEPQPEAVLAAYGSDATSQRAAAHAITGAAGTPGRLPVTIPDVAEMGEGITLDHVSPRVDVPEAVGMDGRRLARVDSVLRVARLDSTFPGAAVAVGRNSTIAKLDGHGYYTYDHQQPVTPTTRYDLASLTKVVATTTAAMLLYEEGKLDLDAPVVDYLPDFAQQEKGAVTVRQLLSHSSGLRPYLPPEKRDTTRKALLDTIMAEPLEYTTGTESRYSGLGIITLMRIIETVSEQDFETFCEERIFTPLGLHDTGFNPVDTTDTSVVPTTDTMGTYYQGSVHDPIARKMGGVSGNAGLFSTAKDLSRFATMLVNDGRIDGRAFLKPETIETFTAKADVPSSTRALGWDTKSAEGYSSAGDHFSNSSFGHTGYTGTSLWIDPEQDLFVLLLTNRVYPNDTNTRITEIRPKVANRVYQSIVGPAQPLLPGSPPSASAE